MLLDFYLHCKLWSYKWIIAWTWLKLMNDLTVTKHDHEWEDWGCLTLVCGLGCLASLFHHHFTPPPFCFISTGCLLCSQKSTLRSSTGCDLVPLWARYRRITVRPSNNTQLKHPRLSHEPAQCKTIKFPIDHFSSLCLLATDLLAPASGQHSCVHWLFFLVKRAICVFSLVYV